jgi:hypothetical protein
VSGMSTWQEPCSLSLERLLQGHRIPFLIGSVAAGVMVVIVFRVFSSYIFWWPWSRSTIPIALAMGVCLTLQLIGIPWCLSQMREAFLSPRSPEGNPARGFYQMLRSRLCNKTPFYATLAFVLLPFVALNILQIIRTGGPQFFAAENTVIALLLDIFNTAVGYLLLYFLAVILWLLLVVGWTLNDAQGNPERSKVPVDILSPDRVGGLGPVQDMVRSLLTYYFIIVTLLIISYLSPTKIWSYEALFVIMLFIAGILFFFIGFKSVRNLARGRIVEEIGSLNQRIRIHYNRLKESVSDGEKMDLEALKGEQSVLDACYKERDRLMTLYEKNQAFDIRTIAQSVASLIIPVLAFLVQLSSGIGALKNVLSLI